MIHELLASLRQLRFPPAFRIPRPESEASLLEEAECLLGDQLRSSSSETRLAAGGELQEDLLVRVATGLWRLRQRMIDSSTGQPKEEVRRAYRHVESLWDTLAEFGVEIQDHDGQPFDSGMALRVLSYEHDPSVSREMVKETIKPTVYLRARCIQRGEVIVGSPEE